MTFKKKVLGRLLVLVTVLGMGVLGMGARSSLATTATYYQSGQSCQGATDSDRTQQLYSEYVAANNDSSNHPVVCPVYYTGNYLPGSATVYYYDRNDTNATTALMSCYAQGVNNNATVYSSETMYSCSTVGGCTNGNGTTTANTYWAAGLQTLSWNVTSGSSTIANSSIFPGTLNEYFSLTIHCAVPAYLAAHGYSGVVGYTVNM